MPNSAELLRLAELQNFASQGEADRWFAEQEAKARREADRDRQRRFREKQSALADKGRTFVELLGRRPADEIELKAAELAERDSITFSEALDHVLRDDPQLYSEQQPDDPDGKHDSAFREGIEEIDTALLARAEELREPDEPLYDAYARAYREWDGKAQAALDHSTARLEASESRAEGTASAEDELLELAERKRKKGQSLRDAIDHVLTTPEGVVLMKRAKAARGQA